MTEEMKAAVKGADNVVHLRPEVEAEIAAAAEELGIDRAAGALAAIVAMMERTPRNVADMVSLKMAYESLQRLIPEENHKDADTMVQAILQHAHLITLAAVTDMLKVYRLEDHPIVSDPEARARHFEAAIEILKEAFEAQQAAAKEQAQPKE